MDNNKKHQNYSRSGNTKPSSSGTDSNRQKSSELQSTKYFPKNSRRREPPQTSARNNSSHNNNQQQQSSSAKVRPYVDKRPRARGYNGNNNGLSVPLNDYAVAGSSGLELEGPMINASGEVAGHESKFKYEFNSVYSNGCRKQNLNHLLNFYYTPRDVDNYDGVGGNNSALGAYNGAYGGQRYGHNKKHKYNKEQFLQANFQFVIKTSAKRKTNDSPDTLIDWALIEQINLQTPEEPQCPICLYPPSAAKVTRCGHVYCWPCVLHYLSLSDKSWRKCPICYDAVHVGDLKSASIVQQKSFNVGLNIRFQLMRRKKGSLQIERYESWRKDGNAEKYPYVSSPVEDKIFSKFILAKRGDIIDIVARERQELLNDVDASCPEFVFVQQAIELLNERLEKLGEHDTKDDENQLANKEMLNNNVGEITTNYGNNEQLLGKEQLLGNNEESQTISTVLEYKSEENASDEINIKLQPSGKYYYFYQADDGQNIFLHPLNVKMLQAAYGSLSEAPPLIEARILQKEQHSMDDEHRRKFTCLGHLPLTCQFSVVEIELLPPYISDDVVNAFKADIVHRKKERQRRAREERERERHINEINDRQMGKLISSTANINLTSSYEFPTCGFEESLPATDQSDDVPSTSKGTRTKTVSTSSAGSCSYSSIAINCQQGNGPWKTTQKQLPSANLVMREAEQDEEHSILSSIHTNFGDVLAEALSQKKLSGNSSEKTAGKKSSKKSKKMLPLYSTGMNFAK
ncbi:E3 ubiquitin-protein ligase RNF10 [Stomoxys calcitrans]|uniref:E3 ubiquitin-protein ligase RNF10 n=1 Tax=Stomoxys calcitrans TaxID=35570 RepID=UPI0027E27FB3|nr:E3 ubiquitin-protein ligase RNF10 [Stomoxys calcitrans]